MEITLTEKIKIPDNFWQELEAVYSSEKQDDLPLTIKKEFWEELYKIYTDESRSGSSAKAEFLKEPTDEELSELQKAIEDVVKVSKETVEKEKTENNDHPLFLSFSLFEPMGREESEVHYTKTLAWFMVNDQGAPKHGFGRGVFNCLFPLFYDADINLVKRYQVEAEKCEEEERRNRFDIKILGKFQSGEEFSIVIEAKINADEGEEQLKRYEEQCSLSTKLVFLTPDGREPKTTKNKNRWKFISWQQIAINLLRFMESFKDKAAKPEGFHLLKYFTAAIIREIDGAGIEDNPINLISYINKLKKEQTHD